MPGSHRTPDSALGPCCARAMPQHILAPNTYAFLPEGCMLGSMHAWARGAHATMCVHDCNHHGHACAKLVPFDRMQSLACC